MKIAVLTYHSNNILGNDYHNNDHIAFEIDLKLIFKNNIKILSAHDLLKWLKGELWLDESNKYIVITFDDGSELDFSNWIHPEYNTQKSFYSIMKNQIKESKEYIHATSFVIASPKARKVLETTCLGGYQIWGDSWWQKVEDDNLISIENHSWDHLHTTLDKVCQKNNLKGDFSVVNNLTDAQAQISQSSEYINLQIINKRTSLFAYPYGQYNQYLVDEYFPELQSEIQGAFTCEPQFVIKFTNVWLIPRFVCGLDWNSTDEFEMLLRHL